MRTWEFWNLQHPKKMPILWWIWELVSFSSLHPFFQDRKNKKKYVYVGMPPKFWFLPVPLVFTDSERSTAEQQKLNIGKLHGIRRLAAIKDSFSGDNSATLLSKNWFCSEIKELLRLIYFWTVEFETADQKICFYFGEWFTFQRMQLYLLKSCESQPLSWLLLKWINKSQLFSECLLIS